jgi:integrase
MRRATGGGPENDPGHPQKQPEQRGCLRFDRRFPALGVARLQKSSLTKDPAKFAARNAYLTKLAALGLGEELRAFASGEISILDIERACEGMNARGFLKELRAARAGARGPGHASVAPEETLTTHHAGGPKVGGDLRLRAPLWETALSVVIPTMRALEEDSRRRYSTSFRSLRTKAAVMAADEEVQECLATIEPLHWEVLEQARLRGVQVSRLRALVDLPLAERHRALREQDLRIKAEDLSPLKTLSRAKWDALAVTDLVVHEQLVFALDGMKARQRDQLRDAARKLGASATVQDLDTLDKDDWKLLAKAWAGSGSDWNHLRRAISAVLTTLFDEAHGEFRRRIIKRIPLAQEKERTPDLNPKQFWEIVDHLPEELRPFPVVLVLTGMRVGEYQRTQRSDLKSRTYTVEVPGTKTRGSKAPVKVSPAFWSYVDAGVPALRSYGGLRLAWKSACAAAGVHDVTLHDLRHCHGQWGLQGGATEPALQTSLRHATADQTRRYVRSVQRDEVASAVGQVLREAEQG